MKKTLTLCAAACVLAVITGCRALEDEKTFIDDVRFLRDNETYPIVLKNAEGARAALSPKLQGRVMTSTPDGDSGVSCGWINYKLIASGKKNPQVNPYGGEDIFLIGPEGGEFSLYFPKDAEFKIENWKVPEPFNTRTWIVTDRSGDSEISIASDFEGTDLSGNKKEFKLERTVRLLGTADIEKQLGISFAKGKVKQVAFTSLNKITNRGSEAWTRKTGAVSIRIPGMFKPAPKTVIAIPFRKDEKSPLGKDGCFGKIPEKRLTVNEEKCIIFLNADGDEKEKIGLPCERAKGVLGSYDPEHNLLTIVTCTQGKPGAEYLNSAWEIQKEPSKGDALTANNNVFSGAESKLEPFYGLETFSPAAFLKPGESLVHQQTTFHFTGEKAELDKIVRKMLGVSLAEIENKGCKTP